MKSYEGYKNKGGRIFKEVEKGIGPSEEDWRSKWRNIKDTTKAIWGVK